MDRQNYITHYKSKDDVLGIERFLIDLTIKCSNIRFETKLFNLNSVANVMFVRYYYITFRILIPSQSVADTAVRLINQN